MQETERNVRYNMLNEYLDGKFRAQQRKHLNVMAHMEEDDLVSEWQYPFVYFDNAILRDVALIVGWVPMDDLEESYKRDYTDARVWNREAELIRADQERENANIRYQRYKEIIEKNLGDLKSEDSAEEKEE